MLPGVFFRGKNSVDFPDGIVINCWQENVNSRTKKYDSRTGE